MNLLLVIYAINIVSIFAILFFSRKESSVTLSWLLVFIFLPVIGFVLYYFFGSTFKIRFMTRLCTPKNIEKSYFNMLDDHIKKIINDEDKMLSKKDEDYKNLIVMNAKSSLSYYSRNNKVELLIDGEEKFRRLIDDIKNAKESINMSYFIFDSKSEIGQTLINLLAEKAKEGVEVRIIYDMFGRISVKRKDFKPILDAGGFVYTYMPTALVTTMLINYRMHRKMAIIDGSIAYTGGINIGDEYLGKHKVLKPWRDTSIRLQGDAVEAIQFRFVCDWSLLESLAPNRKLQLKIDNTDEKKEVLFKNHRFNDNVGVQILTSGPDRLEQSIEKCYIKMCSSARKYLYIETPYFIPDELMTTALKMAVESGVDVKIIVPGIPDKWYASIVSNSYIEELLEVGIKFYKYNGFIHSKSFVMDDYVTSIGSTNVDIRSFALDYEMNAVMYDEAFAITNKKVFMKDLENSTEVIYNKYRRRSIFVRIIESLFKILAPIM